MRHPPQVDEDGTLHMRAREGTHVLEIDPITAADAPLEREDIEARLHAAQQYADAVRACACVRACVHYYASLHLHQGVCVHGPCEHPSIQTKKCVQLRCCSPLAALQKP
jgi:hypothetical protein